jgi:hypothetical protein
MLPGRLPGTLSDELLAGLLALLLFGFIGRFADTLARQQSGELLSGLSPSESGQRVGRLQLWSGKDSTSPRSSPKRVNMKNQVQAPYSQSFATS